MGQDNRCEAFHRTLRRLLDDPAPLVRWNAALALARFGDPAGEQQLQAMLQPFTLNAPRAGRLEFRAREGDTMQSGGIVARLSVANDGNPVDVVSPIAGALHGWQPKTAHKSAQATRLPSLAPVKRRCLKPCVPPAGWARCKPAPRSTVSPPEFRECPSESASKLSSLRRPFAADFAYAKASNRPGVEYGVGLALPASFPRAMSSASGKAVRAHLWDRDASNRFP